MNLVKYKCLLFSLKMIKQKKETINKRNRQWKQRTERWNRSVKNNDDNDKKWIIQ